MIEQYIIIDACQTADQIQLITVSEIILFECILLIFILQIFNKNVN